MYTSSVVVCTMVLLKTNTSMESGPILYIDSTFVFTLFTDNPNIHRLIVLRTVMKSAVKTLAPSAVPLKKKNPWGRPPQTPPTVCSLAAVMDEELAKKLQQEDEESSR